MSQKFHINIHGMAVACEADKIACPRGGESEHFDTYQEALDYATARFEQQNPVGVKRDMRTTSERFSASFGQVKAGEDGKFYIPGEKKERTLRRLRDHLMNLRGSDDLPMQGVSFDVVDEGGFTRIVVKPEYVPEETSEYYRLPYDRSQASVDSIIENMPKVAQMSYILAENYATRNTENGALSSAYLVSTVTDEQRSYDEFSETKVRFIKGEISEEDYNYQSQKRVSALVFFHLKEHAQRMGYNPRSAHVAYRKCLAEGLSPSVFEEFESTNDINKSFNERMIKEEWFI